MKKVFAVFTLIVLVECKSSESLTFYHKNSLKIFKDEIKIKLLPNKNKDSAFVRINYFTANVTKINRPNSIRIVDQKHVKFNKYIPIKYYNDLVENFHKIDPKKLIYPQYGADENGNKFISFGPMDAGLNKLTFRLRGQNTEYISHGISEQFYFETTKNILKIADLKINSAR